MRSDPRMSRKGRSTMLWGLSMRSLSNGETELHVSARYYSLSQPLLLSAIAAHLHLAPAAVFVLRRIEEEPSAILPSTLLDPGEISLAHETERRQCYRSKDCFYRVIHDVPCPPIDPLDLF